MTSRLWQRLTELNSGFISQYGLPEKENSAFETWCVCLKDLTIEQFKTGIEKYEKSGKPFIDAVTFYRLAGGNLYSSDAGYIPNPFIRIPDLRTPEERCAIAKPWIEKIRKDLAKR